jgi:hypothetical protein
MAVKGVKESVPRLTSSRVEITIAQVCSFLQLIFQKPFNNVDITIANRRYGLETPLK